MAFWRPFSMDSWNPLSGQFWSMKNLVGSSSMDLLQKNKKNFSNQVENALPDCFKDPVTSEWLSDFVITPYGHCMNRDTLAKHWAFQLSKQHHFTCPFTNLKLNKDMLIHGHHADDLEAIIDEVQHERRKLLNEISNMQRHDLQSVSINVEKFKKIVVAKTQEMLAIIEIIKELASTKDHLCLDIHNPEHLRRWHNSQSNIRKKINSTLEI